MVTTGLRESSLWQLIYTMICIQSDISTNCTGITRRYHCEWYLECDSLKLTIMTSSPIQHIPHPFNTALRAAESLRISGPSVPRCPDHMSRCFGRGMIYYLVHARRYYSSDPRRPQDAMDQKCLSVRDNNALARPYACASIDR
jgi:hypothetical protein